MANFERQELRKTKTIADKLKSLRLAKDYTLSNVAKKLSIPEKYLFYLESAQYDNLPGDIYVRAWLKKLAEYYQVASSELLVDYQLEKNIKHKISKINRGERKNVLKNSIFLRPRTLRWLIIGLVVLGLLVYLVIEILAIIAPPYLKIIQPVNNYKTKEATVEVVGQTKPEAQLLINGELIPLDQGGAFKKIVNLSTGLNNLKISAKKKHSQTKKMELLILRESTDN